MLLNWFNTHSWSRFSKHIDRSVLVSMVGDLGTTPWLQALIPRKQTMLRLVLQKAIGLNLVGLIFFVGALNPLDCFLVAGSQIAWWAIPSMLLAGFVTLLPYNHWRLEKMGKACH